jgi:hypothetical protein
MPLSIIQNPGGHALGRKPLAPINPDVVNSDSDSSSGSDSSSEEEEERPITTSINQFSNSSQIMRVCNQLFDRAIARGLMDKGDVVEAMKEYSDEDSELSEKYFFKDQAMYYKKMKVLALNVYRSILEHSPDLIVSLPEKGREWARKNIKGLN